METKVKSIVSVKKVPGKSLIGKLFVGLIISVMLAIPATSLAHCDSYDGPVIKDAYKALETNNVSLVLKWIDQKQEQEITTLFDKTYKLRSGDKEIYQIVEKHFLETLVRLHRETEGAPYSGLKPAGTTKKIVVLSDKAIDSKSVDELVGKLNSHIEKVVREKFNLVSSLYNEKDKSAEKGREYVKAYIDYTHTLEVIHDILEHGGGHEEHKH